MGTRAVHLVMVDDDDIDVRSMRRSLERAGSTLALSVARDGCEALDHLRRDGVARDAVVILDMHMPRMGGIEFLAAVRADAALASLPVFVLTTSDAPEDLERAYAHHVVGYVLKQAAGEDFGDMVDLLDRYCALVERPD